VSKFNTTTNSYTIGFLAVMVAIVGLSLAFVSSALEPTIQANIKLDEKKKILSSIFPEEAASFSDAEVNEIYNNNVKAVLINSKGEIVAESIPDGYDFKANSRAKEDERLLPLYIYEDEKAKVYVVQMIGLGLWDEINGYLALADDKITISGVAFDHKGETPGLGAEIVKPKFKNQFPGKQLFDNGKYKFEVFKAGKYEAGNNFGVDGISGATITVNGVHDMVYSTVNLYENFFAIN
jgi:Na+-transporting NADH:ubiquinone oxidoreductase subunit C